MDEQKYYSVKQVAEYLGKNEQTIRDWATDGLLIAIKINKEWLFPKDTYMNPQKPVKCPLCDNMINDLKKDFRDDLSRREFRISGMCQKCQDEAFAEPES